MKLAADLVMCFTIISVWVVLGYALCNPSMDKFKGE